MTATSTPERIAFPRSEADLTPSWFTAALRGRFPGCRVRATELERRIGGTATKYKYRLDYAGVGPARPPETLWVKGGFETGGADQGDAFANEVRFYLELAPALPISRPDCYFGMLDPASNNGLILLEDLDRRPVRFGRATEPLTPAEAAGVLAMQADYHARFWEAPALAALAWLKPGGSIAGAGMVGQYFAAFWDTASALPRFRHVIGELRDRPRLERAIAGVIANDAAGAHCLVHGDSHMENLFFAPDGRAGYLDWQHVMRGHWAFDFANLVVTGLRIEDRRAHERDLLGGYRDRLGSLGVRAPAFADMWEAYRRHALWSFMWTMCPVSAHPEDVCTVNAERACAAILHLESLAV